MFDVVSGISVFTHISERGHLARRDELVRLLAPNGLLFLTLDSGRLVNYLDRENQARFHEDEFVEPGSVSEGTRDFRTFYPKQWVRENLIALSRDSNAVTANSSTGSVRMSGSCARRLVVRADSHGGVIASDVSFS